MQMTSVLKATIETGARGGRGEMEGSARSLPWGRTLWILISLRVFVGQKTSTFGLECLVKGCMPKMANVVMRG